MLGPRIKEPDRLHLESPGNQLYAAWGVREKQCLCRRRLTSRPSRTTSSGQTPKTILFWTRVERRVLCQTPIFHRRHFFLCHQMILSSLPHDHWPGNETDMKRVSEGCQPFTIAVEAGKKTFGISHFKAQLKSKHTSVFGCVLRLLSSSVKGCVFLKSDDWDFMCLRWNWGAFWACRVRRNC